MDLRKSINYLSDVVVNRPMPIREIDQIYMKHADMLLQIEHVSKWFTEKNVVFIGDGDGIALGLAYLQQNGQIDSNVQSILVLDFDERIINSINKFASKHNLDKLISAKFYNVAFALPREFWHKFDAFHCNPPFGSNNDGISITSFVQRGIEATNKNAYGCVVLADVPELPWTCNVLYNTQQMLLRNGFIISEMIPKFHTYHLDDAPDLTSCSIDFRRVSNFSEKYNSKDLKKEELTKFYGLNDPLKILRVKDLTERKQTIPDYELIPFDEGELRNEC